MHQCIMHTIMYFVTQQRNSGQLRTTHRHFDSVHVMSLYKRMIVHTTALQCSVREVPCSTILAEASSMHHARYTILMQTIAISK
jgi:hypothetical protein